VTSVVCRRRASCFAGAVRLLDEPSDICLLVGRHRRSHLTARRRSLLREGELVRLRGRSSREYGQQLRHVSGGRVAIVSGMDSAEKCTLECRISAGSGLTRQHEDEVFVREGRDLDPHRVEAPIDDSLMTCRYLMGLRKRALIRPIPPSISTRRQRVFGISNFAARSTCVTSDVISACSPSASIALRNTSRAA
jgi:hypothetical protein